MTTPAIPIGLQLYSVRDDCQEDLAATLNAVADMGYQGVELAGLYGQSADTWKQLLSENGLAVAGAHVALSAVEPGSIDATIAEYAAIGCDTLVVPALPGDVRASIEGYRRAIATINAAAATAAGQGIAIGYHNHDFEFTPIGGTVPYHIMLAEFDSAVLLQFDFGWVYRAGADGVALVNANPGRQKTVHIKAYDPADDLAVVGADAIPWTDVFAACESVGNTRWYIVEHERYRGKPLDCVKQCLDNLRAMGK